MCTANQLREKLREFIGTKILILGIGNTLKGDDGIGSLACQRLLPKKTCANVIDAATVPENYIQQIVRKSPRNLIVIDAVDFAAPPGTVKLFRLEELSSLTTSTHAASPLLFIDMVKQQIDLNVCFIGVQPAHTKLAVPLSAEAIEAVQQLVDMLLDIFRP